MVSRDIVMHETCFSDDLVLLLPTVANVLPELDSLLDLCIVREVLVLCSHFRQFSVLPHHLRPTLEEPSQFSMEIVPIARDTVSRVTPANHHTIGERGMSESDSRGVRVLAAQPMQLLVQR